jgi:hypothetical protein
VGQDLGLGERPRRSLDESVLIAQLEVDHGRMLAPRSRIRCLVARADADPPAWTRRPM